MQRQESTVTSRPLASLVAATDEAARALGDRSDVRATSFPFRVGRERRKVASDPPGSGDLRLGVATPSNDVYLLETQRKHLHISRKHFAVEYNADKFFLLDRGSSCGTIVAGRHVGGGRAGGHIELQSGDEIVVGTHKSPYVFRFHTETD